MSLLDSLREMGLLDSLREMSLFDSLREMGLLDSLRESGRWLAACGRARGTVRAAAATARLLRARHDNR
jgi:DNA-binding transcriptional ArsR family regulator